MHVAYTNEIRLFRRLSNLPSFPGSDPNREDDHDGKTRGESTEHKDVTVVGVSRKAEELQSGCQRHDLIKITIDSQGSS